MCTGDVFCDTGSDSHGVVWNVFFWRPLWSWQLDPISFSCALCTACVILTYSSIKDSGDELKSLASSPSGHPTFHLQKNESEDINILHSILLGNGKPCWTRDTYIRTRYKSTMPEIQWAITVPELRFENWKMLWTHLLNLFDACEMTFLP